MPVPALLENPIVLPVTWKLPPEELATRIPVWVRLVEVIVREAVWKNRLLLKVQSVVPVTTSTPADDAVALKKS